jgi:hypothetical protein
MAECIPDRLSAKASRGEKRTFALLKKLPDDYPIGRDPRKICTHEAGLFTR